MGKRVKRVLMIAPTPWFADRGCHMHIAEQAYALQRRGLEVKIVTYHLGRDLPDLDIERAARVPWYTKQGPGPSWHKFYVDGLLLLKAWAVAKRFKPDVIHAHLHEGCVLGKVLSTWFKVPLVFDVQGSLTGELIAHDFPLVKTKWLKGCWYELERWIDSFPDALVAQSTEMRGELTTKFGVAADKITMAYDGVNTWAFTPGERDEELAEALGITPHDKVVVYLGGLNPHKGADVLLEAFARVVERAPDALLLLMGYPDEERYRARARALGASTRVRVTGKILYEEAPRYLTLGDVAVAPKRSQTEANGKIYNYMAAGLPTVAFDTVVNRDILGELAEYVSGLDDIEEMAAAIVKLLENDAERKQLAEQVRTKAVRDYSWDDVAGRLVDVYQKVLPTAAKQPQGR